MRAPAATVGAVLLIIAAGSGFAGPGAAQTAPAAPRAAAQAERPRLIVFISVDQFRRDYVERYGGRWTSGLAEMTIALAPSKRVTTALRAAKGGAPAGADTAATEAGGPVSSIVPSRLLLRRVRTVTDG